MKKIWNIGIKVKITVGFTFILIVLISVQYGLNKSISNVIASQEELLKSTKLSTEIESIKSSVCFFESKVKGYVLTGNDSLLENNEKYLNDIVSKFSDLKKLAPNPEQIVAIDKLVGLLNDEIALTDEIMFQYQINPNNSIELIKSDRGRVLLTNILKEFQKIHDIEEVKYKEILSRNKKDSELVKQMDASAYVFAFLLITLCVWVLFRDISKRERLEKELIITQKKAEHAAAIKEQFMANMSHEIRTPLNAIIGFNARLNKTKLDAEQKEYAEAVQSSGENLLAIVNDILDFSKIEAGMVRIEKIRFNLPNLLQSLITMFVGQAKEKQVNLELKISQNVPQFILGDPTRLTQILINLIGNALKFTNQGSVCVEVDLISIHDKNVTIIFKVIDTGIGIPTEKMPEIFERFTQAKSDTSRIFGGTGLGLSIAKKLVELQSGTIQVESIQGKGSEFSFNIPYIIAEGEDNDLKKNNDNEKKIEITGNLKILVVEDNILNQKLASFMLKDWNIDFDICDNGKLAVEKLKSKKYNLILMDIQMPEMNGYEATEYIRNQLKLTIPIIAMTADALPGEKEKCISFGMTDYISKPIKAIDLKNLISTYINIDL
ncbi:MAG: hybrid sensor histidine kinase/response regulator [Sphingobacteriaceae bacterium]|nr:hybrid sensor histidine kinase/response regulator [Sphingobacteriaceae bacterium]